jgi:glycosyltransferase involved in cell wall biosynthesis/peptidoglycan/xylan/chitin deacetylase (PgdA/CDA1 family)
MAARLSVVIPTFQRRPSVLATVQALAGQEGAPPFEVVVVVDGSTDGTAEALRALRVPFPLRVVAQENRGAARARNAGWRAAAGEVVLFLDDDMEAAPDVLARHDRAHHAGADAVTGGIGAHPGSRRSMLTDTVDEWYARFADDLRARGRAPGFDEIITGQLSVRRAVLEELGGFDERFCAGGTYGNEDIDLGHRLLAGGHTVVADPDSVTRQRYTVTAAEHLRQYHQAGRADVVLVRKHPHLLGRVFDAKREASPIHRRVWRPVLAAPRLTGALARLLAPPVARRVDAGVSGGALWWAYFTLRESGYWRGVAEEGGIPRHGRLRVLCYHAVADLTAEPALARYGVPGDVLAGQLDTLAGAGWRFVSPDEVARFLRGEAGLPRRALLVTFDDCYTDLATAAAPVLSARGVPAAAFAVAGRLGGTSDWDRHLGVTPLALLDADGLARLPAHGVEVGAHGRTHRALPTLDDEEVVAEVAGAVADLADRGLARPRLFAYPYGAHDARARAAVRAAGLAGAFTVDPGVVTPGADRWALPRIEVFPADVGPRLLAKVATGGRAALVGREARALLARARRLRRRLSRPVPAS